MGTKAKTAATAGKGSWPHRLSRTGAVLLAATLFAACGMLPAPGGSREPGQRPDPEAAHEPAAVQEVETGRFQEPGELDRLVDAKPLNFPAVKTAAVAGATSPIKAPSEPAAGKGRFRIQVGAENDIDAAQSKKAEYERKLGGTVDVVFDAPYYKLRWGYFETKQDADDKILEISEFNIQGFVVKQ